MVRSTRPRHLVLLVLALLVLGALAAAPGRRVAWAEEDDVTSRDVEQAFRTLRDAVRGGVSVLPATRENLQKALTGWGVADVERTDEQILRFTWNARALVMVFGAGTGADLILRYQHTRPVTSAEALNDWNSQALTMGYIDRRQDIATLELNVLAESTPHVDEVKGLLARFALEVERFAAQMDAVPASGTPEGN